MFRSKILQVRLEHAKQKIDIVSRLRNFENAFVNLFVRHGGFVSPVGRIRPMVDLARIRERNLQGQFFCYDPTQPQRELLQKTAEHEKKRLGCFNLVLELKSFLERLRRSNQFEHSIGSHVGTLPHSDCFRAKSRGKLLLIKRRQLTKRVDSPLVENGEDFLRLHRPLHAGNLRQTALYVQVNSLLDNLKRTLRQRLHEGAAVGLADDAIVENNDDAAVSFGSDQAADALAQFKDCFWQGVFGERIAAARLDQLEFRFNERMIGHGKWQPCDNHIRKRFARNIHAAPKTVGSKEYAARR